MSDQDQSSSNVPSLECAENLLQFWLGELNDESLLSKENPAFAEKMAKWYGKDPALDQEIRDKFQGDLEQAAANWDATTKHWGQSAQATLALIILTDQLSRNMFRDTARMYDYDDKAVALSLQGIQEGTDKDLTLVQRMFFYMPLMHSEKVEVQDKMVVKFKELADDAAQYSPQNKGMFAMSLDYAHQHRNIVARFGRFPHRNAILSRESTAEEIEFLKEDGSSF